MTDPTLTHLAGVVILAGGNSRRMGSPKAKLTLPTNETLLDYHIRHALELNVPIMIADNERRFTVDPKLLSSRPESPIFHIADYRPTTIMNNDKTESMNNSKTGGPLVAIESALQALTDLTNAAMLYPEHASWLMVISCDSLIPANNLWQKLNPYIVAGVDDGLTSTQSTAQSTIQTVDKSVICLTDEAYLYPLLGIYRLSIESELLAYIDSGQRQVIKFIEPMTQAIPVAEKWQQLTNFNTPEDFKRACAALYDV